MARKTTKSFSDLLGTLKAPSPDLDPRFDAPADMPISPDPAETPTVTIANLPPDDVVLPGFAMADSPEELPDTLASAEAVPAAMVDPGTPPEGASPEIFGEILSTQPVGEVRYESRIRVLEAYQYPGNLKGAPDWIDRNWIAYAPDYDPLRNIEPGPALRVPTKGDTETVLCRPGDYVVKQSVTILQGVEPDIVVEVWARESFEKNFLPDRAPAPELAYESG